MSFKQYLKENEELQSIVVDTEDVIELLKEASEKLGELQNRYERATGYRTTDFLAYKSMIDEVISSDGGEAGLEPFMDKLFRDASKNDI